MMRGNHVLVVESLGRHYQCRHIVSVWIDWHLMLCVGFPMVTTTHSESLSRSLYFSDTSIGVHLLSYTGYRGLCNSLGTCRPFHHTLLLYVYLHKRLMIDRFSFLNTLRRWVRYVLRLNNVLQTIWSGFTWYLIPSWLPHRLGIFLDIHLRCAMTHLLKHMFPNSRWQQRLWTKHLQMHMLMQSSLNIQR